MVSKEAIQKYGQMKSSEIKWNRQLPLGQPNKQVEIFLKSIKWDVLPDKPYSPDLALSDYYLFRFMQHGLSEQNLNFYEEIKNWINEWYS